MTEPTTTTTAVVIMATSLIGFLSLLATLVFLWKVYKRGGRHDLTAAARALRDARPRRLQTLTASLTPTTRPRRRGHHRRPHPAPPPNMRSPNAGTR